MGQEAIPVVQLKASIYGTVAALKKLLGPYPTTENLETLQLLNLCGFTVSLSADNLEEADVFYDTGLPVVTVLPMDQMENTTTPAGRKVVVCPAVVRDDVTCSSCGLCQVQTRNVIVGFPSHGTGKAKAQRVFNLVKEPV